MSYKNCIKFIILTFIIIIFIRNIYINNSGTKINADNMLNISLYEENIIFSNHSTDIKPIALYYPYYYPIQLNNKIPEKSFSLWDSIKNANPLYEGHHQPRIPDDNYINIDNYDLTNINIIEKQIKLAKNHGIYGFGIYYYWFSGRKIYEKPLEIFFENKNLNFNFLIIWRNNNLKINNKIIIEQKYEQNYAENFFDDIKKYLNDLRYIRNNGKPIIGIYKPEKIKNLNNAISDWRKKAKENGIGEIFILVNINQKNYEFVDFFNKLKIIDGGFEIPPNNLIINELIRNKNFYFYSGLFYRNKIVNITSDFILYRGIMLEYDNSPINSKNIKIFDEYTPEKLYYLNKIIIQWTKNKNDINNRFIFINSWNNWNKGTYLEPDKNYGYSSINSLSKSLFNLPYKNYIYNISNLKNETKIAIQVHVFYEDIMPDIIKKTNNIPVKFDLYITTNNIEKKIIIENLIKNESKASKYEIIIVENKGRDVLPYLTQLKNVVKNYKYICHLHTKKSKYSPYLGELWRNYLYNNLFGDEDLISEILTDFENNDKLGIIFPETYYFQKKGVIDYNKNNIKYMNYLLDKIFKEKNFKIGEKIIFPSGNMFWARVEAIYQVFEQDIKDKCPRERNQLDATMMHGVERIWLFVAKLNGFYYKTKFKYI